MELLRPYKKLIFMLFFTLAFFSLIKSLKPPEVFAQRRVVGRIVNEAAGNFFQPGNDDDTDPFSCGAEWETVAGAEDDGTLIVSNSNGSDSDWGCNDPDKPFYDRKASSGGQGPHTFTLSPPTGYDCSEQVRWGIGYAGYTPPAGAQMEGDGCVASVYLGPDIWDNHLQWFLDNSPPPDLECSVTANAQCINDGNQVEVTWDITTGVDLVWDRFVVRGAHPGFPWGACPPCIWRDIGEGNTGARSTIFDVVDDATIPGANAESGANYLYTVTINDGCIQVTPEYCSYDHPLASKCVSNDVYLTCENPPPPPPPNDPPVCIPPNIDPPEATGIAPFFASFSDTGSYDLDGSIVEREWDFGDGTSFTNTINSAEHTFDDPGDYEVVLTVTDDDGAFDVCDPINVLVEEAPQPPETPELTYEQLCDQWRASIRLSWNVSARATDFDLQKCSGPPCSPGDYDTFESLDDTTFLDEEVSRLGRYQYRIRAHNSDTDLYSNYSNWLTVIAPACEFCAYTGTPVADPDIGSIFTAIGCIPTKNTQRFTVFYLKWGMGIAGGTAMVLTTIAGFMIISAGGDPRKVKAGKELLGASIGGMFLFLLSTYILRIIGIDILRIPGL